MAARASAGATHICNALTALYPLTDLDARFAQVSINCFETKRMTNLHDDAITALASGKADDTVATGVDRRATRCGKVHAVVHAIAAPQRIAARSEARRLARALGGHAKRQLVDCDPHQAHPLQICHQRCDTGAIVGWGYIALIRVLIIRHRTTTATRVVALGLIQDRVEIDVRADKYLVQRRQACLCCLLKLSNQMFLTRFPGSDLAFQYRYTLIQLGCRGLRPGRKPGGPGSD